MKSGPRKHAAECPVCGKAVYVSHRRAATGDCECFQCRRGVRGDAALARVVAFPEATRLWREPDFGLGF